MKRVLEVVAAMGLLFAPIACSSETGGGEVPAMLRHQFQTQMKIILHDVKVAEEQAMAFDNTYLELEELRRTYFNRVVPDNYTLSIGDVSANGFQAEVVHKASGLSCNLEVGGSGGGIPKCD